ncbi:MAG: RimK family alpha-L-glutamate ligase [Alphaproteobacteria bacterium]
MKFNSFFPNRPAPTFYAMASDDLPLHFDMEDLTEKQKADHFEQNQLVAMLQVALMSISKPEDYVAQFDQFLKEPWAGFQRRQHDMMARTGFPMVPLDHVVHGHIESFYEDLAEKLPPVELVSFLMMSRSNENIHQDQAAIDRMLKLNSKFHFAENAPGFGIPVPETLIATQPLRGNAEVEAFFAKYNNKIVLKMTGQPGGRNVKAVSSLEEAEAFLEQYREADPVLVQQRLPLENYVEWTADLYIDDRTIELDNVRRILDADGLWIGNLMPAKNPLTPEQEATLLKIGDYVRQFGIGTPVGENTGIDYFVGQDGEIVVTEINPRWTAGLFPSQALKRVDRQGRDACGYFELVELDRYGDFLDFVEAHLPGNDGPYSVLPLGFSPYERDVEGTDRVFSWTIVIGDFPAYRRDAKALLGEGGLPNGDMVPL